MSEDGVELKIRGSVFKTDFRELLGSVFKAAADAALAIKTGGVSLALGPNIITGLFGALKAVKIEKSAEFRAWILVSGGILYACEKILLDLSISKPAGEAAKEFMENLAERVATRTYTIEADFFSTPNKLPLLDDVAHELAAFASALGSKIDHKDARARLERYFPSGLQRTWMKDLALFETLELGLNSPFVKSAKAAKEREAYLQYVEEEFTQIRLIGQDEDDPFAIRLAQVFVPLRAYVRALPNSDVKSIAQAELELGDSLPDDPPAQHKRTVTHLDGSLDGWIAKGTRRDWLRIVSGGPGIGKSSSMRAYTMKLARTNRAYPILVPLQKLDKPTDALRSRIAHYLISNKSIPLTHNPLDDETLRIPIVIIFDGLDELVRPGTDADDISRDFMNDLQRLLEEENGQAANQSPRVLAIVTGRITLQHW